MRNDLFLQLKWNEFWAKLKSKSYGDKWNTSHLGNEPTVIAYFSFFSIKFSPLLSLARYALLPATLLLLHCVRRYLQCWTHTRLKHRFYSIEYSQFQCQINVAYKRKFMKIICNLNQRLYFICNLYSNQSNWQFA